MKPASTNTLDLREPQPTETPVPPQLPSIEPSPVKPGYKTSELYVAAGVIAPLVTHLLQTEVSQDDLYALLNSIATLITVLGVAVAYIKSRREQKTTAVQATAEAARPVVVNQVVATNKEEWP